MNPTKYCNCIRCTDCQYYNECLKYEIESERKKGKSSFGKIKEGRIKTVIDRMKD